MGNVSTPITSTVHVFYLFTTTSTSRRTFGKAEWEELESKLSTWLDNLSVIRTSLEQVVQHGG